MRKLAKGSQREAAGRRCLRTSGAIAIGVNITPTCTTIATSDLAGVVSQRESFQTDPIAERTLDRIIEVIRKFSDQGSIEGVGVSVPGLVTPATGDVIFVPYFKWRDLPLGEGISRATGLPVTIDNDANTVALAELWFGRHEIRNRRRLTRRPSLKKRPLHRSVASNKSSDDLAIR